MRSCIGRLLFQFDDYAIPRFTYPECTNFGDLASMNLSAEDFGGGGGEPDEHWNVRQNGLRELFGGLRARRPPGK